MNQKFNGFNLCFEMIKSIRNVRVHWAPMLDPFGLPAKYDQELNNSVQSAVAGVLIEPQEIWPA